MSPTAEKEYFERAAMSNKKIGHVPDSPNEKRFFRWNIAEFETDLASRFKGISLILEKSGFRERDNLSDNRYLEQEKAFWILAPIQDSNNYDHIAELEDETYQVVLQMYTKLVNDKAIGIFKGYDPGSFTATPFTDLNGTATGWRCAFRYLTPAPTELNSDDWNTDTTA